MNSTVKITKPTKSFFEITEVGKTLVVKVIVPLDLCEILFKDFINMLPKKQGSITQGELFNYAKTNLKFIDSNSEKLMLDSISKVGVDIDTKTLSYQLIYRLNKGKITWCINTFMLDVNANHVNLHRLNEANEYDISTSVNDSKFAFPTQANFDMLYSIVAMITIVYVGYLVAISN